MEFVFNRAAAVDAANLLPPVPPALDPRRDDMDIENNNEDVEILNERGFDRFVRHHRRLRRAQMFLGNAGYIGGNGNNDGDNQEQQQLREVEVEYMKGLLQILLTDVTLTAPPQCSFNRSILSPISPTRPILLPNMSMRCSTSTSSGPIAITINCAHIKDEDGRLPLHLAVERGLSLSEGLKEIIDANINGLLEPDGITGFYPFALAQDNLNASYSLLLQNPAVIENILRERNKGK